MNDVPVSPTARAIFFKKHHGETPTLTIGKVAAIAGASPKAIRHYEKLGLLPVPHRRGKYRLYSERDVFLVHVLKHAQTIGFRLPELKVIIDEKVALKRFPLRLVNRLFDLKCKELEGRIAELQETIVRIGRMRRDMNRAFGA